jgi:sulfofructose kinase
MPDVFAYGVIAASTLIELADPFPPEAGYAEIVRVHRSLGGEAAGSAYVLARLGVPTKLAGSELGADQAADWVIDRLSGAGVDCTSVARVPGGGVTEMVVTSGTDRTIFASYGRMLSEMAWTAPQRADVRSSRMVCLDSFLGEDSERVARWCVEDRVPYVTIDTAPDSPIAGDAAAIVVSAEFSQRRFGTIEPAALLDVYADGCHGLVILTGGGGPMWYRRRDTAARSSPSFEVEVRDTTGAGDAFRAGVIASLLEGQTDDQVVRRASAIAAMVCRTAPGVIHSPTAPELAAYLDSD